MMAQVIIDSQFTTPPSLPLPLLLGAITYAALAIWQFSLKQVSALLEGLGLCGALALFLFYYTTMVSRVFSGELMTDALPEIIIWIGVIHIANFIVFSTKRAIIMSVIMTLFISGFWAYYTLVVGYVNQEANTSIFGYNTLLDLSVAGIVMTLMLSLFKQLTENLAKSEARAQTLSELAHKDSLTGLYNRRYLDQILKDEFHTAKEQKKDLSVALCDIDFFKSINDELSHNIGDETLKAIAGIIKQTTRKNDVISRYGGEEFVIIFPNTSLDEAINLSERVRQAVENHDWHAIHPNLNVTASFGLDSNLSPENHEKMLHAADKKMYEAKRNGKNQVRF